MGEQKARLVTKAILLGYTFEEHHAYWVCISPQGGMGYYDRLWEAAEAALAHAGVNPYAKNAPRDRRANRRSGVELRQRAHNRGNPSGIINKP